MQFRKLCQVAVTSFVFAGTFHGANAEELSVATFVPPNHETVTGALAWFDKEITERSNGSLSMKLYPAGQLGAGVPQQYKRAVEGVVDITFGVAAATPTLFPKTLLAIPPGKSVDAMDSTERLWAVFDEYMADEWSDVKVLALEWAKEQQAAGKLKVEWIVVSDEERAKMEAAAAAGMEEIYADYAERGIPNAKEIYEAINQ